MSFRNTVFRWVDRLHIRAAERYVLTGLMLVYAILWIMSPMVRAEVPYDETWYEPLMQEFLEKSAEKYQEDLIVLERYYPGRPELVSSIAIERQPERYREQILNLHALKAESAETLKVQGRTGTAAVGLDGKVNINTGGIEELTQLPGIGPSLAERIIRYREENGPFNRLEDLLNVRGIGPARFEQFRHMLEL